MAKPVLSLSSRGFTVTRATSSSIPADLKELLVCCDCNVAAVDAEHPVVILCAHTLCLECLEKRWKRAPNKKAFSCPVCTASVHIPKDGIEAFPGDSFSKVLRNSLLDVVYLPGHPPPRCGLHPVERLSHYCLRCEVQVCKRCLWHSHQPGDGHKTEKLQLVARRMDAELRGFIKPSLTYTETQIRQTLTNLKVEENKMKADIRQALHSQKKIRDTAQEMAQQVQAQMQEMQAKMNQMVQDLVTMQDSLQQNEAPPAIHEAVTQMINSVKTGWKEALQKIKAACEAQESMVEKAQQNLDQLQDKLQTAEGKFLDTKRDLRSYKKSIVCDQLFAETLLHKGNDSDKVSRIPGMKSKMLQGKLYSGKRVELEMLVWKSDGNEIARKPFSDVKLRETLVKPIGGEDGSLLPDLQHKCTIPVRCQPAWGVKTVQLFDRQFFLHGFTGTNSDKICFHDIASGEVTQLLPVPMVREFTGPIIVDSKAGVIAIADQVASWTEQMMAGSSKTHLSGAVYWVTISKMFTITTYKKRPMQCVKLGHMSVNQDGCLLVLSHCTTGKHPRQLLMYDKNQDILHQIGLPPGMGSPLSAVNSTKDVFVIVDSVEKGKLWWVDKDGQVLHQYGNQACERLLYPTHVIQHSTGLLLCTCRGQNRLALLSKDATLLQHVSDVKFPSTLHLNEQAGLLSVVEWKDQDNVHVKVLQFCVKTTRSLSVQIQV